MVQFSSRPMTREAALRIGLAARAMEFGDVTALVEALAARYGLPLSETKLATISAGDLRDVLAAANAASPPAVRFEHAVRVLRGDGVDGSELPVIDMYADGELPGSVRVACASNSGENIDGHFGSCERFLVFQVSPTALRLIGARPTIEADGADDRNAARAQMIGDCQLVYVQSIGGPAAAKVVRAGAHPVKVTQSGAARDILARLQVALTRPPPWLAKVMGVEAPSIERYAQMLSGG